jgi:serine/threonine-protein kinase
VNLSQWERAKMLLAEAATLPLAERQRYVIEHCSDPELRREVLELLDSPARLTSIVAGHALQAGARLGSYAIEGLLGSGGMGEVYKARDGTLNRSVAIKVLPNLLADDPDRLSRFRREAQILAALNHPNIAHIYGLDAQDGADRPDGHPLSFIVMELVEGEDLSQVIARGALTLSEALPIARQIIDALDAAHGQGIVHRDLKPANIKIRKDGTVKVLDFGLAKALALTTPSGMEIASVPTASIRSTEAGLVLGTAPYMAPEQALGKTVDKRADIWSFGCVLFEMLSGRHAFAGHDVSDTLSHVIGKDPEWTALPSATPAPIVRMLRHCLHKDRSRRLADIADARLAIEEALSPSTELGDTRGGTRVRPAAAWWRALPWILVAASGGALAFVLLVRSPSRTTPIAAPLRLTAELGPGKVPTFGSSASLALSPNGTELAFIGHKLTDRVSRLFVRRLDHQEDAVLLPETDDAMSPFFSPDGQWLAFFAAGKLKKISVSGGATITLCDAPNGRGGDWGSDGTIFFSPDRQTTLSRVSAEGGAPVVTTTLDAGEVTQRFPQVLPGGKALLYTSLSPQSTDFDFDKGNLVVQPLPTGTRKVLQRGAYFGRYMPSGHLIFMHNGTLFAEGFDLARLEVTSSPIPVIDGVETATLLGAGLFAVSNTGMLAYTPVESAGGRIRPIEWIDRSGKVTSLQSAASDWGALAFAPDGRRFAFQVWDDKQVDIWVADWARGALARLTTSNSHSQSPVWTPDGRRVAFASQRGERQVGNTFNLYWQRADGSGNVQRLTTSDNAQAPGSWHPNGKVLAFEERAPSHFNVMLLAMEGDEASGWTPGKPTTLLSADFDQRAPAFSPDGQWLAYESSRTGELNVYVRPFPGPGDQLQISTDGGVLPTWSQTRRELLYSRFDGQIMVVNYSVAGASLKAEPPRPWPGARYNARSIFANHSRDFDLHPDGNRLALATVGAAPGPPVRRFPINIFLNFFDELRRIAPAQKP